MKYTIVFLLIIWIGWYLYNLWERSSEIKNAKEKMWINQEYNEKVTETKKEVEVSEVEITEESKASYSVKNLDNKNYIAIDDLTSKVNNISNKIQITWTIVNDLVDKITVDFSNHDSDFANFSYQLKTFKKADSTFKYNANSMSFQNLDYWKNKYIIRAYIWESFSEIEIIINIPYNLWEISKQKKLDEKVSYEKKLIWKWNNALFIVLPESELFWVSIILEDWTITYSNIPNLEIRKSDFDKTKITSDNIWNSEWTWYLNKNIDWFVYWNTFREIDFSNKDYWVSFYVLSEVWKKIIYEKFYFDFKNNLKWVLKIDEFDINSDKDLLKQMKELNNKLKEKNIYFEEVQKVNKLFKEIIR